MIGAKFFNIIYEGENSKVDNIKVEINIINIFKDSCIVKLLLLDK